MFKSFTNGFFPEVSITQHILQPIEKRIHQALREKMPIKYAIFSLCKIGRILFQFGVFGIFFYVSAYVFLHIFQPEILITAVDEAQMQRFVQYFIAIPLTIGIFASIIHAGIGKELKQAATQEAHSLGVSIPH